MAEKSARHEGKQKMYENYRHGKAMAERVLRTCERVLAGETESAACRKEDIKLNWIRRFVRGDISIVAKTEGTTTIRVSEHDWSCWQDRFLKDLTCEEAYAPDGFEEIFDSCLEEACNEREQAIIRLRYQEEKTLEEAGREFNVCRDRIRQIEAKAIRKLRHPKYRLPLAYGKDYVNAIKELQTAQAEYDQARIARMSECHAKAQEEIQERLEAAAKAREEAKAMKEGKGMDVSDLFEIPIDDLNLSVRTYNCLKHGWRYSPGTKGFSSFAPIETVGELATMSRTDLYRIRNIGQKCVDEIEAILRSKYGITLRER